MKGNHEVVMNTNWHNILKEIPQSNDLPHCKELKEWALSC